MQRHFQRPGVQETALERVHPGVHFHPDASALEVEAATTESAI